MPDQQTDLPIGILRLREQWRADGLLPPNTGSSPDDQSSAEEYTLTEDQVLAILGISARELHNLVSQGKLECIVPNPSDSVGRRAFKEESVKRYLEKSQRKTAALRQADLPGSNNQVQSPLRTEKQADTEGWREMLLLELRNLKEQQRDLTAFVYELAEKLHRNGCAQRKRRWYFLWLR